MRGKLCTFTCSSNVPKSAGSNTSPSSSGGEPDEFDDVEEAPDEAPDEAPEEAPEAEGHAADAASGVAGGDPSES